MMTLEALSLWRRIYRGNYEWEVPAAVIFWFSLAMTADLWFWFWARRKLLNEFRLEATRRFQPKGLRRVWWFFGRRQAG